MLRRDVVEAAEAGKFRIYSVENVDQAIAILTGLEAGEENFDGKYPKGSINHRVVERLAELTGIREMFARRSITKMDAENSQN